MTAALVAFLRARLDDDERVARAVGFECIETGEYMWNSKYLLLQGGVGGESKATAELDGDLAIHIARQDPARTLREVEAKRQLADLHHEVEDPQEMQDYCAECDLGRDRYPYYPCTTLRLLAAVYADHPDYLPEWRP